MSFQAQNWANKQKTGNISGRAILMTLANYADERGQCYPSQSRLAEDCECSERTIRQWLDKLEELGLITRVRRNRGNGSRTSDLIILNMNNTLAANIAVSDDNLTENFAARKDSLPAEYSKPTGKCCRPIISQINQSEDILSETSSDVTYKKQKQKSKTPYSEQFEKCWKEYPTDQNMSKKEAFDEWKKLSDEDKLMVERSIIGFKAYCSKDKTYRPIHFCRFIKYRRFEGFSPQESQVISTKVSNFDDERWSRFLELSRPRKEWREDLWGAAPHQEGCKVPAHLLKDTDGKDWRIIKHGQAQ